MQRRVRQRLMIGLGLLALLAVVAIGLAQAPGGGHATSARAPTAASARALLAGSPAPLASLHAQASALLDGGDPALRRRLASLRGYPVVVNKWASWCGPCRQEFPVFQQVSVSDGRRVAFVGIDSADGKDSAGQFLRQFPVSYPSYLDASGQAGTALTKSTFFPVTAFITSDGRVAYIHQGPYSDAGALERDVRRYAEGA